MRKPSITHKSFYYGWVIAISLAFLNFTAIGLLTVNLGLFIGPMSESLGLSPSLFGWAQTARLIGSAFSGIVLGRLLDAFNARIPLMIVSITAFLSILYLSSVTAWWQIIIIFFILGALGLAQSGGNLFIVVPISRWFFQKRGKALTIAFFGFPVGVLFLLPATQLLITGFGWRHALIFLGIGGGIILFATALTLIRSPEDIGLLPDGLKHGKPKKIDKESEEIKEVEEDSWTKGEAIRSSTFWKLSISTSIFMFATSCIGVFRIPYFVGIGIDPMIVSYSLSVEAVFSMVVSFLMGRIIYRFQTRFLAVFTSVGFMLYFIISIYTTEVWHVFMAQIFMGIAVQSRFIIEGHIWPSYFGKKFIGSIRGFAVPFSLAFSFLGPPFVGVIYDRFGSYVPAWWFATCLLLLSALLYLTTPKPVHPNNVVELINCSNRNM